MHEIYIYIKKNNQQLESMGFKEYLLFVFGITISIAVVASCYKSFLEKRICFIDVQLQ